MRGNFALYIQKINTTIKLLCELKATSVHPKLLEVWNSLEIIFIFFKRDRVYSTSLSQSRWSNSTQRESMTAYSEDLCLTGEISWFYITDEQPEEKFLKKRAQKDQRISESEGWRCLWSSYTHRPLTLLPRPKAHQWVRAVCPKEPTWLCRGLLCSALATWNNLPRVFVKYTLAVLRFSTFIIPHAKRLIRHSE